MKRDEENIDLEPDGWCGTPPRCMPDIFHNEPEPRTWTHVCITLVGIAACTYMVGATALDWIDEPYITNVELASTLGNAYPIKVRCASTYGCRVEASSCSEYVTEASIANLADGDSASFELCASPDYADGLLVTIPLAVGAESLFSPIEVLSGDNFVGLPPAPLTDVTGNSYPTHIGVTVTESIDIDGNTAEFWSFRTDYAASKDSRCKDAYDAYVAYVDPLVVGTDAACYQLRFSSTETIITNKRAFTGVALLEAWGGAYGFIFGLVAMALLAVEKAGWFCFWRVWA